MTKPVKFEAHLLARKEWALRWLRARTEHEGECWLWQPAVAGNGLPSASIQGSNSVNVRRWVFGCCCSSLVSGQEVVPTCGNRLCLNPEHLKQVTRTQRFAQAKGRGAFTRKPQHIAAITAARRASAKYTPEQIEHVRRLASEDLSVAEIARRAGVGYDTAWTVCRGRAWKAGANGASVFSWGGIAA